MIFDLLVFLYRTRHAVAYSVANSPTANSCVGVQEEEEEAQSSLSIGGLCCLVYTMIHSL